MSERIYYVFCEDNCRFEGLTKEQIIAAIAEATGNTPQDVDAAFITKIKEQNANKPIKIWVGTQAEFNAITEKDTDTIYYYDDTAVADLTAAIENIINGTTVVAEATHALNADNATNADNADNATHATNADNATNAANAVNTDFTNAEWIDVTNATEGATGLIEGATYEVVPYNVDTYGEKKAIGHAFITYDGGFGYHDSSVCIYDSTYLSSSSNTVLIRDYIYLTVYDGRMAVIKRQWTYTCTNSSFTEASGTAENKRFKYRRIR